MRLANLHPRHHGIVLAAQQSWSLGELIDALDRLLSETEAGDLEGQIVWLNRWRSQSP